MRRNGPIVFLDIDGVLNTSKEYGEHSRVNTEILQEIECAENEKRAADLSKWGCAELDGILGYRVDLLFGKAQVECLNEITKAAGAQIVVSSTWRFLYNRHGGSGGRSFADLRGIMKRAGVEASILGSTPPETHHRGDAIVQWLREDRESETRGGFVILDDEDQTSFPSALRQYLVRTDGAAGLVRKDVPKALRVLGVRVAA